MKKLKLFMASPDDTGEERRIFTETVDSINRSRAEKGGFHLEPIIWEKYAYPEVGNPQTIINKLLEDAALLVVCFSNKFGASTDNFPSGTMEEFSVALNRRTLTGTPSIKVYFRDPLPIKRVDELEELGKVLKFKESIKNSTLYKEYSTTEDFRGLLNEHINAWLTDYISSPIKHSEGRAKRHILAEPSHCKSLLKDFFERLEKKYDGGIEPGLDFGLDGLTELIGEKEENNLFLIAGESSSGKTSLMLTLVNNTTIKQRIPTIYFSMRSDRNEIMARLMSNCSELKLDAIRRGELRKEDWHKITSTVGLLADSPLFVDDNPQMSLEELSDQIERFKQKHEVALVILDGLNYVVGNMDNLGQELRIVSRQFQATIVASVRIQTSSRLNKTPCLNDLAPFGDLRTEADKILFLHGMDGEERKYFEEGIQRKVKLIVAKNNSGPITTLYAWFLPELCRFNNYLEVY